MNLVKISTKAGQPYMNEAVAPYFEGLRKAVITKAGFDFLVKCGDVFRDASLKTNKTGVAFKSNHKAGRAFDYDQTSPNILIVNEPLGGKMYFHTFLKCAKQDGSLGYWASVHDKRGFKFEGYVVDFTRLAGEYGFVRIPAREGWQHTYNNQEFWHYQKMDGLTWEEAMAQIQHASKPSQPPHAVEQPTEASTPLGVYRLGSKGEMVGKIQSRLTAKGFPTHVDKIYGTITKLQVMSFQHANKLYPDGIVGPETMKALFK